MSTATCYSAQLFGLSAEIITVEVDISNGLNAVSIVGLGDRAVEEARDRISAAIKNSGFVSPKQKNQKVVISLAPADVRKGGPSFDLPMAIAYLAAAGEIKCGNANTIFLGELSLEGKVRKVHGVLPILRELSKKGIRTAYIPIENQEEASYAKGVSAYGVSSLAELVEIIRGTRIVRPIAPQTPATAELEAAEYDMSLIKGNTAAKRALEISAAGGHNVLMYGPPGTGKTMLASSFPTLLPNLTHTQALDVTCIHSAGHLLQKGLICRAPFRAPHHTASFSAIIGGGNVPRPGEITLAHHGVLFLDEFPEFDRSVIEALREPLEERRVTISRARGAVTFPAHCIVIAAMNPCPCGKPRSDGCVCTPGRLASYRRRISAPILDRFDLWVSVDAINYAQLAPEYTQSETSSAIQERIIAARKRQAERFKKHNITKTLNSAMSAKDLAVCARLTDAAQELLLKAAQTLKLSGRGFHRIIKISRTIADLAAEEYASETHVLEALQYRQKMTGD